jgi:arylformamidase
MKVFDISRPLFNGLAPWPGDTAFRFDLKWKMADGASVNVGATEMGVHNGSHADAPFHFETAGATIDKLPLDAYLGEAVVVDLTSRSSSSRLSEIAIADLEPFAEAIRQAGRILLKTGVWSDAGIFPESIPVIARDVPQWLRERKVKLLGLDLPSVDGIDSKTLDNHHALSGARIAIVESLDLSAVTAGTYRFSALPLRIVGGDAAPVRAVLWQD